MALATRPPESGRPARGPRNRLPRSAMPVKRGHEIQLGLLGVLGLLALVGGVPALLVIYVGYPLPTHAPSRDWLTQSISATLVIKILACVAWVVWAHFTVCLLTEWRAVRRGRLPSHVAFGGGSQLLARKLVAAALLLGGAATAFPHGSGSSGPAAHPIAAVAGQQAGQHAAQQGGGAGGGGLHTSSTLGQLGERQGHVKAESEPAAEATKKAGETKYYIVKPPHGRRYDSLWDIAHRTLNDPLRYKEIFALNKDRIQADGSKLVDANLIRPGWELRLPSDASGPGVHVAHAAAPVETPRQSEHATHPARSTATHVAEHGKTEHVGGAGAGGAHQGVEVGPGVRKSGLDGAIAKTQTSAVHDDDNSITSIVLGGGMMLAGVLVALTARRGPYSAQNEDETALGLAADPGLAALLDRALRDLAASRTAQGRGLPQPVAAWVSSEQITLNLAAGDVDDPPAPWRPGDIARSWTVSANDITERPPANVAAPFPGLLSVGRERGYELFVDFEQAPGPIALAGNLELARELASALAVQAATSLWSDGARVTAVGFGDGVALSQIEPRAIKQARHLGEVLDDIEHEHADLLRLQRELGVDGVLTGRQTRRSDSWQPHFLVLSGPPTPDEASRLQALAAGRSNLVVLVVGDLPSARWRFVVDPAGRIDLGSLGAGAQAHRLTREAVARLAELLTGADRDGRSASRAVAALTPHHAVAELSTPLPPRPPAQVAASVALLGRVEVGASGPLDTAKRDLLTEIVVAVALAPTGAHEGVLRSSIWPRGVSEDVFTAAMSDAAAWLGRDASGQPCLYAADGRWHLAPSVAVDWFELRRLADAAGADAGPDALTRAIALFRGEAFSGTPAGRYHWLAFMSAAREARVVGTAVARRAADALGAAGRDAEAETVLRRGLALVPASEVLWRDLLSLAGRRGPEPASAVADEMYATLRRLRAWPESETDALVAQLAPGYGSPDPERASASVG